jgi:hypothetical protein
MTISLKCIVIISIVLLAGLANAMTAKELSGLNFTAINGTKELLDASGVSHTSSITAFLSGDDAKDGAPYGNKKPLQLGSLTKNNSTPIALPALEAQVAAYLNETVI